MDCKEIATVSRSADEREGNIADRTRYKTFKKLKSEFDSKNVDGGTRFLNHPINKLPNEILCKIFSSLNIKDRLIIETVCPRWREVGFNSWNDICVVNPEMLSVFQKKLLKLSTLIDVLKRCNLSLRKLEIDFTDLWIKRFPQELCSYCPNLISIILRGKYNGITTEDAMEMVDGWKNLTAISLPCAGISEECLTLFFSAYNIEYLDLTMNSSVVGNSFCLLKDSLKRLILNGCNRILSENLKHIANLHGIMNLQLNDCDLTVSTLISIVKSLQSSLVELNLGGHFYPSDNGQTFSLVASYCQNIQILHLAYNDDINDNVVSVISKTCLQLRVLNLSLTRVTNESLRSLSVLPRLQHLCVNDNDLISKDGIRGISESQSLERIELQQCQLIENQDIVYLAKNCRTLKAVDIKRCLKITRDILMQELKFQLRREEGYTLDIITRDYVISRIVCKSSKMVVHEIYKRINLTIIDQI